MFACLFVFWTVFSVVQASRSLHSSPPSLAPLPPLPEKGGKVRHGIFPEELFTLLYPKTGVTGNYIFCLSIVVVVDNLGSTDKYILFVLLRCIWLEVATCNSQHLTSKSQREFQIHIRQLGVVVSTAVLSSFMQWCQVNIAAHSIWSKQSSSSYLWMNYVVYINNYRL